MSDAAFHELFPLGADDTPYRKLTGDFVSPASFEGERVVKIAPDALTLLARQAFVDCQHLLRPGHLAQLRTILDDPGASANDKFVALDLLKNANIAAGKVLPVPVVVERPGPESTAQDAVRWWRWRRPVAVAGVPAVVMGVPLVDAARVGQSWRDSTNIRDPGGAIFA